MADYVKINELKEYHDLVEAAKKEQHVILKYGGPCKEHAEDGGIHVFYGAPCKVLDNVKELKTNDYIGLRYGSPCIPPYVVVKYGSPCKALS